MYDCNSPVIGVISLSNAYDVSLNFCLAFINQDLDKISIDHTHRDKSKFVAAIKNTSNTSEKVENGVARNVVRKHLDLKHPYYIDRGFSAEILDKYDCNILDIYEELYENNKLPNDRSFDLLAGGEEVKFKYNNDMSVYSVNDFTRSVNFKYEKGILVN